MRGPDDKPNGAINSGPVWRLPAEAITAFGQEEKIAPDVWDRTDSVCRAHGRRAHGPGQGFHPPIPYLLPDCCCVHACTARCGQRHRPKHPRVQPDPAFDRPHGQIGFIPQAASKACVESVGGLDSVDHNDRKDLKRKRGRTSSTVPRSQYSVHLARTTGIANSAAIGLRGFGTSVGAATFSRCLMSPD